MAKGSVRKRGKKWYYRFYVDDDSGKRIQREFVGTESKAETEAMLRNALKIYEEKHLLQQPGSISVGDLLDRWLEEEVKPGTLSNGTLMAYEATVRRIKQFPIGQRKLKTVTPEHLQDFFDQLTYGEETGTKSDYLSRGKPISRGYMLLFTAVMNGAFHFAVYPGRMLQYNLMEYVKVHRKKEPAQLFREEGKENSQVNIITEQQFAELTEYLEKRSNAALLPVQIAYYSGLRLGEVCGLIWQDIDLEEHTITVRRSIRYNGVRHCTELGTAKRGKIRVVYFGNVLAKILREAYTEQERNRSSQRAAPMINYYKLVQERDRIYYEVYTYPGDAAVPENYKRIDFVCIRSDGSLELPGTVSRTCRIAARRITGLEGFHFHQLRHTYTSNLLKKGASPKEVQELLGHQDINTTMNIYAHADQDRKRSISCLLDQIPNIRTS